jgi:hypothetical protein
VLRNQNTLEARAISNATNVRVCNPATQGTVVSSDDAASEVVYETRSLEAADGHSVLVTRKKRRDVGKATSPVNPQACRKTEDFNTNHSAKPTMTKNIRTL